MADQILCVGPLPHWVSERYFSTFEIVEVEDASRSAVLAVLPGRVVAIVSRGPVRIDGSIMDAVPGLRAVARTGVGLDTVDVEAATARGIPVLYTPGAMSRAVAEHTVALILAAAKDLAGWHRRVLEGEWQQRYGVRNTDLKEATLGIIGLGRIGRQVWELMRAFEVRVLVCDPYLDPVRFSPDLTFVSLTELLERSDVVTLHVPLTAETRSLINTGNIASFKKGAILVNTARGPVVENYQVLLEALERGRLGYLAMDTLIAEPPRLEHPIFRHPRAIFTAHVAARTPQAQRQILETMGQDLGALLAKALPRRQNLANPEILFPDD